MILIVEDENEVLNAFLGLIAARNKNLKVLTAPNRQSALELLEYCPEISVLVTDLEMDRDPVDGVKLLQAVRRDYPNLRSMLMSGNFTQEGFLDDQSIKDGVVSLCEDGPVAVAPKLDTTKIVDWTLDAAA